MIRFLLIVVSTLVVALFLLTLAIPKAREYFFYLFRASMRDLWRIVADYTPRKGESSSVWLFSLAMVLVLPVLILLGVFILVVGPTCSIIMGFKHPNIIDERIQFDKDVYGPRSVVSKKRPVEIEAENTAWNEKAMTVRFSVDRKDLPYEPDEQEVFFYTPKPSKEIEDALFSQYDSVKDAFERKGYSFVFLPYFNKELNVFLNADRISYYNPKSANLPLVPEDTLTYQDIKEALKIPEKVDGPCFIRCKVSDEDPLVFTFWKVDYSESGDVLPIVEDYLRRVGRNQKYAYLASDDQIRQRAEGEPADERFDTDVYLIGKEIRDRIAQLQSKGLTTLAIRKLIGDESDKPGKLYINKHNKVYLTDYGNKEIKMEPLQKAVFFLFLRHPEGIFFKDLGDYRDELGRIYKEITGRDDSEAIERSINRLTDPLDNSINEKCARIKNAFVSEFREEVAQWYFIDGTKGEKKTIKLPRELVTWEIKD